MLLQIHEIFGIEKASDIRAVIRASKLRDDLLYLRKTRECLACLLCDASGLGGTSTRRQGAAHPDGTLGEMGQEFRANGPARPKPNATTQRGDG